MVIPNNSLNSNETELDNVLNTFCAIADIIASCDKLDNSNKLPSECESESSQWWAWMFGQVVATYVMKDEQWRDTLFCEGTFVIDRTPTKIYPWNDIWGETNEYGKPNRLIPLAIGALLSSFDMSRDWHAFREHCICMWQGSYTSYGKPISEINPSDDLYWAMRIGFAEKVIEKSPSKQESFQQEFNTIKEMLTSIRLNQEKKKHDDEKTKEEILARFPPTKEKIRSRILDLLGNNISVISRKVLDLCVEAEQYSDNQTQQLPAIIHYAKAVEACLNDCIVIPLIEYLKDKKKPGIEFGGSVGYKDINGTRRLSLREWGEIINGIDSLNETAELRRFLSIHYRGTKLPNLHALASSLQKIQRYRNIVHDKLWENPNLDLVQMRSLVLGTGDITSVLVMIVRLLRPHESRNGSPD